MKVLIKKIEEFPNWSLAIEFLRRSPLHFLLSNQVPPEGLTKVRRLQIILKSPASHPDYLIIPGDFQEDRIKAICETLVDASMRDPQPFLGSVRSSNFISFLHEFSKQLVGKSALHEVAQAIIDKTCELFNAEGASILVPNRAHTAFRFAYRRTIDKEVDRKLSQIEVPIDQGVSGWVARHRKPLLLNNTSDMLFNKDVDQRIHFQTREILAAPITIGDDLLGVIQVLNPRSGHFQDSDMQTVELIAAIIAVFIEKANLHESMIKYAKVQKEFEIAHALQDRIMPGLPSQIGAFSLIGESRQMSRVGGDFWDIFEFSQDEKLLIIGDVSGHGLSAALMMSAVRTATRALLHQIQSPYALIEPLNYLVHREFSDGGHYVTLILCHIKTKEGRINYFRAGHEKPILKTGSKYGQLQRMGGLPIGLLPFRKEDPWNEFDFKAGDCLFLYTDGIVDGLSNDKSLIELLSEHPHLEKALEDGHFFETLKTDFDWEERDDATFLRLSLT